MPRNKGEKREKRKRGKLGFAAVPLEKLAGLSFLSPFFPNSNIFIVFHGDVYICGAALRQLWVFETLNARKTANGDGR